MNEREDHLDENRVVVNDKRRIDPATGQVRGTDNSSAAPAPGGEAAEASEPVPASAELEAAKTEAAERTADLQRITAEYANYRKRVDRDRDLAREAGKALVLAELLTVLDDVDRAETHGDLTGAFKAVADKLTSTLQRLGLNRFGEVGDEFDPSRHEAVHFDTSPQVVLTSVGNVMRHGYLVGDKLIRPAVVGVVGPENESAGDQADDKAADHEAQAES